MKRNMGDLDRLIRILVAVGIIILYLADQITGVAAIILLAVSGIFILTSIVSWCPIWAVLKVNTIFKKHTAAH